MIKIQLMEKL